MTEGWSEAPGCSAVAFTASLPLQKLQLVLQRCFRPAATARLDWAAHESRTLDRTCGRDVWTGRLWRQEKDTFAAVSSWTGLHVEGPGVSVCGRGSYSGRCV